MIILFVSIAALVCLVVVALTCLNCFKKPKFQTFQNRQSDRAISNPSFTVDITDSQGNENVAIEPLPDILAKNTVAVPLRPKIICSERGKQDATLSLISVQRSFPREQIQYLNEVESGWFGKVLDSEASKIVSGSIKSRVMVKMLKDDATKYEQKQFLDEVLAFRCLEHANLLGLLGQCIETTPFLVILEFAPHGNLKTFLIEHRLEAEAMIKRHRLLGFAVDAVAGLACLHRHGYIHNDLAARNCLVMSDYSVKIGDYGISDVLFKEDYMATGSDLLPIRWMAPESLIQSQGVWTAQTGDKISDMWAFGVLLWEIFSFGDRPYNMLTDEAVLQGVVLDKLLKPAELDSRLNDRDKLWQLMGQCWQDPTQRVQVEQLYQQMDHLTSARRDTFEVSVDFEQRWEGLQPNKRASSVDTDMGSHIALAGSFVGSTATERSSVASSSTDVLSDFISSSESKTGHVVEGLPVSAAQAPNGGGDTTLEYAGGNQFKDIHSEENLGSGDAVKVDSSVENTQTFGASGNEGVDLTPVKPVAVSSSTPSDPKKSETSEFFSPMTSTPASLYTTAFEASEKHENASKDSVLTDNDSTFQFTNGEAEMTHVKSEFDESIDSQHLSEISSDFVKTSPIVKSSSFDDLEPAESFTNVQLPSEKTSEPETSTGFSDFGSNEFSTLGLKDTSITEHQESKTEEPVLDKLESVEDLLDPHKIAEPPLEKVEELQSLSLQFESLKMDSLVGEKVTNNSSPFTANTEETVPQDTNLIIPEAAQGEPTENVELSYSGPLLDEDIDHLVQSSYQPVQVPVGDMLVPSLPSEPAPLLPVETTAPQVLAFTDVPEQGQSLMQNLESLPVHLLATETLERSQESLMAALGESLESHPKSLMERPEELQGLEVNLLEDTSAEDPSSFDKKPSQSDTASSSIAEWDLLGLEAEPTHLIPSTETAKESSSSSEPNQATLIDLL